MVPPKIVIVFLIIQLFPSLTKGQEIASISYNILNAKDSSAIVGAKISLIDSLDIVKRNLSTDEKGNAIVQIEMNKTKYKVVINAQGYTTYTSNFFLFLNKNFSDTIFLI